MRRKVIIASLLLLVSLALLVMYGIDVIVILSTSPTETFEVIQGFIPLDPATRGMYFGGLSVAMSVIGFVVARKDPSRIVSGLLLINGILIIVGILLFSPHSFISLVSTIALGLLLVSLGVWKVVTDSKKYQ